MNKPNDRNSFSSVKKFLIGKSRDLYDEKIFHRLTLVAFFAWIGLGSDGISSSCYGPEESYRTLGEYHHLSFFVGIAIIITIAIISTSYSQIIKLFPSGGGGYKVATKLLSPKLGMISGCSLLVDYVLTISMSVSSGADALFSLLPPVFQSYKIFFAVTGILVLIVLNLRGIKESVFSLMPIFILFVLTHLFLILYSLINNVADAHIVYEKSVVDFQNASRSLGVFGVFALMLRSFSMGAGTFTGMEAVSNSIPILKEPKVRTGLITMRYMAFSLGITVMGLFFAYSFFDVVPSSHKTLNAVLLESFTSGWGHGWGIAFVFITLFSEAALLFIAAQTGFLDGPRVMSSMAMDKWFPTRFTVLSDRLVTQNGVLFMGVLAIIIVFLTGGSVRILVVLYSINVFITFALSQAGMVRHWWLERKSEKRWFSRLSINGIGLVITLFILFSVITIKFREGGWITIIITSLLILAVSWIKKHYAYSDKLINRMDKRMLHIVDDIYSCDINMAIEKPEFDNKGRTAVICVSGFNGLGIQTFFKVKDEFKEFRNIVFLEVGIVDSGNFKGSSELDNLENNVLQNLDKYKQLSEHFGFYTECYHAIGTDVADEIKELSKKVIQKYSNSIFFIGQFIIPKATAFQRFLHNQTQLAIHNRLSHKGYIMVMVPIRSHAHV